MPRLRRVDCASPGFRRRRRGRGFSYEDEDGRPLSDAETLARIAELAVPPAWRDVWICPDPLGHLQAVGTDDAGRRQYLYHPRWRELRDRAKFDEMLAFARALPALRRAVSRDLKAPGLERRRVLASAIRLLDRGFFRVGGEEYAAENGTYGLATIEKEHVALGSHDVVCFDYVGKAGKRHHQEVRDRDVHAIAAELIRRRGAGRAFLAYRNGKWRDVRSDEINERIKELTSDAFSAKHFRTWHATALAAAAVAASAPATSRHAHRRVVNRAVDEVAACLGNTPAVCRASYNDPRVFDRYRSGETIRAGVAEAVLRDPWRTARTQRAVERATLALLEGS
jgi:DNA topoisomerase IB